MATNLVQKLRGLIRGQGDRNASRVKRRQAFGEKLYRSMPVLKVLLLVVGFGWLLAVPSHLFGQRTYIDENALQPAQVNTHWNWGDVHRADRYLEDLEQLRDANGSSYDIAVYLSTEFRKLGISSDTQNYTFTTSAGVTHGTNAYAISSSPRASGAEAILISASRISRTGEGDGTLNLRGISTVLSLAGFLKNYSLWAKDLIFVLNDGYLEGMQAWLSTYHGAEQSNLLADPLKLSSGVIWTALNIDYPGHSFSHLGVFFEGLNGRLPNQDLYNSFHVIATHTGGVPVLVYDHIDPRDYPGHEAESSNIPTWLPETIKDNDQVKEYAYRVKNVWRHFEYQSRGRASGVHGLMHKFRIDAITIFAIPATGPHGFHALGRIIESTLRTMNNLLERLHASFFFYLLVGPGKFMKIGMYLPSVVIISVAMMFAGLHQWVTAYYYHSVELKTETKPKPGGKEGEVEKTEVKVENWTPRDRPVLKALGIIITTHLAGIIVFYLVTETWLTRYQKLFTALVMVGAVQLPVVFLWEPEPEEESKTVAPLWMVLQAFNLCLASTVISITSVLNFSLAALLAVTLAIPLMCSSPVKNIFVLVARYALYLVLALGWTLFLKNEVRAALWNWEVLGVWFAPFVCIVYAPLMYQAAIVGVLST
ncbi:GPI transamidase component Gaa1 [Abortiporus biennis]